MTAQFVKAGRLDDIEEGTVKEVEIDGNEILLARKGGQIYAMANVCTHDGGNLGEGKLDDGQVICPRHGARFDIKTGDAVGMPAVVGIETYAVKVEDGDIHVALPD